MENIIFGFGNASHENVLQRTPQRRIAKVCNRCKGGIYEGERFLDLDGEIICPECVDEMSAREVFKLFGYYFGRAR